MSGKLPIRTLPALITGGAGFIGTNLAERLLQSGREVILYDNFSRAGVEENLRWLMERYSGRIRLFEADVRDEDRITAAVAECSQVFHFAAQVAVTTSLNDPLEDFDINVRGTLQILEAIRRVGRKIPLLFTSTNKVYGDLSDVDLLLQDGRYEPVDSTMARRGVSEKRSLDFHSPYGCSKGAADQYVLDYARTFGLSAVVFRMSCIYGPHQFGTEDQGWVAHFVLRALRGEPITLYGDGRQVRDVLYVDDLVEAMISAHDQIEGISGRAFNIGGGPKNTLSLLELIQAIEALRRAPVRLEYADWRAADQRYYVSDIRRFSAATGWLPKVPVKQGVGRLHRWIASHRAGGFVTETETATSLASSYK